MSLKKFILVKKTMDYLDDENLPAKRPTFLTVLCILTFVGSGWAIFSSITAYNTAETTVNVFSDSRTKVEEFSGANKDTLIMAPKSDTFSMEQESDSLDELLASDDTMKANEDNLSKDGTDTTSAAYEMGRGFGEKIKKNVTDMMSVEKLKNSAVGSFIAALFTLAGAFFMWLLRKYGFYIYIIGIAIGIIVPFYIYGNNLLAVGLNGFSSFFGLLFIALYAVNLKSMK